MIITHFNNQCLMRFFETLRDNRVPVMLDYESYETVLMRKIISYGNYFLVSECKWLHKFHGARSS